MTHDFPRLSELIPTMADIRPKSRRYVKAVPPQPLRRPLRGILFDMCNILYDDTVWRRWVLQLLGRLGLYTNYHSFFRLWDRDFLDDVHTGRRDFREAFGAFLRCAGLSPGQINEVEAASHARRRHLEKHARPLPGVRHTLWRLHQAGFIMGLVCDSEVPSSELRARMQRFGIDKLFPTLVSSIDLRQCMPVPEVYLAAVKAMDIAPEQVAFVGHDRVELAGAASVGMATIAFNFAPDAQADVHLTRFEELILVLGSPL
jgi:beta-phosphoglucomutase-like phosphatase (HAD superfamily)